MKIKFTVRSDMTAIVYGNIWGRRKLILFVT